MRATRGWIAPTCYTCPGCGKAKPTIGWHEECRASQEELPGQSSILDELDP